MLKTGIVALVGILATKIDAATLEAERPDWGKPVRPPRGSGGMRGGRQRGSVR